MRVTTDADSDTRSTVPGFRPVSILNDGRSMRLRQLDSLRGIAALLVVCAHLGQTFLTLHGWQPDSVAQGLQWFGIRSMIACGANAVLIFFALSGFVLTLSFIETDHNCYWPFAVKRIARIYLPFLFAILLAALLYVIVAPKPILALTPWFNVESWYVNPSLDIIAGHLLMTGQRRDQELDHVMWSLVHELRISLIFPFLVVAVQRFPRVALVTSIWIALTVNYLGEQVSNEIFRSLLKTASYLYLFVTGALYYFYSERIQCLVGEFRASRMLAWSLCFLAMFFTPFKSAWGSVISGLGACGLLALCYADTKVQPFFHCRFTLWLGRVSYSLYLIHLPIILAIMHLGYGRLPLPILLIGSVLLTFSVAELSYRYVERPATLLGKSIATYKFAAGWGRSRQQKASPVKNAPIK